MRYAATFSAALLIASGSVSAADNAPIRPSACVSPAELRLASFSFSSSASQVHKKFRNPIRSRSFRGEDDGGDFRYVEESFDGIVFTFGRDGSVDGIAASSKQYALPSGIRVGMEMVEVAKRLRFSTAGVPPEAIVQLPACEGYGALELELTFSLDRAERAKARSVLKKIGLWATYD